MNASHLNFFVLFFALAESASIPRKNDTLEILKNDVSQVGSAIENFTFDIIREMMDEEETSTEENKRQKRSVEDEVKTLCQKRCEESERIERQQIKDLKSEVKKLQDMVKLLKDQQKIIDILDNDNATKQTRADEESDVPNSEELARMKNDLKEVIKSLNETREVLQLQKEKDEMMEEELAKQNEQIESLKNKVQEIVEKTTPGNRTDETPPSHSSARASGMSSIRKLLKSLPDDDLDTEDDTDLRAKLLDLQKHLSKKRRQESLLNDLKHLEKTLDEDGGDNDLLRQIIAAIKKTEPKGRTDDVTSLAELQEAIDRLRPKEDETAQFQAMLNKLINKPGSQRPSQITITPQQMNELTKKLTPNNYPPICIVDDGSAKNNGYRQPGNSRNFQSQAIDYAKGQQFFPGQITQPSYYAPGNVNGGGYDKGATYQTENGAPDQRYQDDLRQQIEGLQAAIDSLNTPEYMARPEDKAIVDDLERQIGDLRNIVNNLNYDTGYQRSKRSLDDNEVTDNKAAKQMVEFMGKLLNDGTNGSFPLNDRGSDPSRKSQTMDLNDIQTKIDGIKNQLGSANPKARTASYDPSFSQLYSPDPAATELRRSFKNDFLSQIIGKILDKVIDALPVIIQKLLGFSLDELSKYDYQDYDVQVLYKNLGIFAYLPVILLRLVKGITAFMNMLRKSSFIKNFLVPALVLGTVAGSVLFLIWWLQADDGTSSYNYASADNSDPSYQYPQNQYPASYNYPVYNRSYFNK